MSNVDGPRAHRDLAYEIACEPDDEVRARRATEELLRIEAERADFTAIRDVAVYRLAAKGASYSTIGRVVGLTKERGAQLVRRANEVHGSAVQHVAKLKRRNGGHNGRAGG